MAARGILICARDASGTRRVGAAQTELSVRIRAGFTSSRRQADVADDVRRSEQHEQRETLKLSWTPLNRIRLIRNVAQFELILFGENVFAKGAMI